MDVFVVRQPIFDRSRRTHAYQLVFRGTRPRGFGREGPDPPAPMIVVEVAATAVLGAALVDVVKVDFARNGLLHGIYQRAADLGQIERIIKAEVSLSMTLLTYINSAAFGQRQGVASIGQALLLLGVSWHGVVGWAATLRLSERTIPERHCAALEPGNSLAAVESR